MLLVYVHFLRIRLNFRQELELTWPGGTCQPRAHVGPRRRQSVHGHERCESPHGPVVPLSHAEHGILSAAAAAESGCPASAGTSA